MSVFVECIPACLSALVECWWCALRSCDVLTCRRCAALAGFFSPSIWSSIFSSSSWPMTWLKYKCMWACMQELALLAIQFVRRLCPALLARRQPCFRTFMLRVVGVLTSARLIFRSRKCTKKAARQRRSDVRVVGRGGGCVGHLDIPFPSSQSPCGSHRVFVRTIATKRKKPAS